jgi:SDR family mycofactocin-dependent oxidoreductase
MSDPGNRVALVTGAARGIGAATVVALAASGWCVVAADRCADDPALPYPLGTRADLDRVVATACAAAGAGAAGSAGVVAGAGVAAGEDRVVAAQADTRDAGALAAAVALAEDRWHGLDAAIAAAGVIAGGVPAWQVPLDQERAVLDIDLGGVLTLARVAVPALLRRPEPRHGRFLAVASAAATRGLPMLAAYCAAKAGVAGFIRALAAELGGTGVTANAVSPGSTATPILDESARLYDLPDAAAFAAQQPLGRLLQPAEVAAVLAFLAGDGASAMTGAVVPVDGGLALLALAGRSLLLKLGVSLLLKLGASLLLELGVQGDINAGECLADRAARLRLRGDLGELLGGKALRLTAHGELDAGQPEAARRVGSE